MTYFWDTNIVLYAIRKPDLFERLNQKYNFGHSLNKIYISSVTVGEIHSIAFRNRWGDGRMRTLKALLDTLEILVVDKDDFLIKMYCEIDAYSQSQHPILKLPTSARKMGKNDLWIAATAAVHNATLISTDADFDHLDGLFLYFDKIIA